MVHAPLGGIVAVSPNIGPEIPIPWKLCADPGNETVRTIEQGSRRVLWHRAVVYGPKDIALVLAARFRAVRINRATTIMRGAWELYAPLIALIHYGQAMCLEAVDLVRFDRCVSE